MSTHHLPIVDTCDLLVLGGTAAAVAAALSARAAGLRVLLAAPRPYLGEDISGALRFRGDATAGGLAAALFSESGRAPSPLHAKRTLEQALLQAGVPFLMTVQVAGLVRDAQGKIAGAVLADRNGMQVVQAHGVLDASERGLLGDAAGCARAPWTSSLTVRRALCSPEAPVVAGATVVQSGALAVKGLDGTAQETPIWDATWQVEVAAPRAPLLAALDQSTALACWHPRAYLASELVEVVWPDRFTALDADGKAGGDALWLIGACAKPDWRTPATALAGGAALGARIAADLPAAGIPVSAQWCGTAGTRSGSVRVPTEGLRAGPTGRGTVAVDPDQLPALDTVDVVVCGGGTGGAPAGISAARFGARTAVLELLPGLGGVSTMGQICRYYYGNRVGFTHELDRGWPQIGADCKDILDHCRRSDSWSPEWRCRWLLSELAKAGGTAWFIHATAGAVVDGDRVCGLVAAGPWGTGTISAGACVDSSGSADLAAAAGAETEVIGADHVAVQGTGLGPKDPFKFYRNTDHTFVDDNDLADTSRAHVAAKVKFAGAFDLGQLVDSRERRRIKGDVVLQPVDFLRQRRWSDTIVQATSNFDTHGFTVHPIFLAKAMHHRQLWVDVPLRALLPRGLEGVIVTGLGLSSHRDALPVIRMQPDVQNHGYAAGRIAAIAARTTGGRIRAVDIKPVQKHLAEIGNLDERIVTDLDGSGPDQREVDWAVADGLDLHLGLGIVFDRPDLARPVLRAALASASDPARRQRVAMVLGLTGDAAAAPALVEAVTAATWDAGWNYRGMGQFGMSASPVDALVISLGSCAGAEALPAIIAKIGQLGDDPFFSHCRAVAEALRLLRARGVDVRSAAVALAAALARPGMSGHAESSVTDTQRVQTDNGEETIARNRSLREIVVAAALWRCGDHQSLAKRTLTGYVEDVHGHYRRHALAVMAETSMSAAAGCAVA
jgi:hypothetical protein